MADPAPPPSGRANPRAADGADSADEAGGQADDAGSTASDAAASDAASPLALYYAARNLQNYTGVWDEEWVPSAYKLRVINGDYDDYTEEEDELFRMTFEEWKALSLEDRIGEDTFYVSLDEIPPVGPPPASSDGPVLASRRRSQLAPKLAVYNGGVTEIAADAIVNAANSGCMGGGGVDGAVHDAAGRLLQRECALFDGCEGGQARITKGYELPAKFIIHTVGPIGRKESQLRSCYRSCLDLLVRHGLRTIAFCCISTGIFGYPLEDATRVALATVVDWLLEGDNLDKVDRVIFACFLPRELQTYRALLPSALSD